jgi:hypothetical protein
MVGLFVGVLFDRTSSSGLPGEALFRLMRMRCLHAPRRRTGIAGPVKPGATGKAQWGETLKGLRHAERCACMGAILPRKRTLPMSAIHNSMLQMHSKARLKAEG